MKRNQAVLAYIITSLGSIILLLAFFKLPKFIFVGLEDFALNTLMYITCVLVICKAIIDISDFFLLKLGMYSIMNLENREIINRLDDLRDKYKELKSEYTSLKIELRNEKKNK